MSDKIACGIDFGTSNSTVAVANAAGKTLVRLEDNKTTLPSAIFFKDRTGPVFGREAMTAYLDGEDGRLLRGLKKILGTSLMDDRTNIGSRSVNFSEILKIFITHLKSKADLFADSAIDSLVLGRPVHFHDNNQDADRKSQSTLEAIAKDAGFKHIEFLYEPIAAAFAHESKIPEEKLSLVIDLGGGTSDFTIIKIARDKMHKQDRRDDILATSGVRIGGTTFDYKLSLKNFMPALGLGTQYRDMFDSKKLLHVPVSIYGQLSDWPMVNLAQTKKAISETLDIKRRALDIEKMDLLLKLQKNHLGHALLGEVENTKIALTDAEIYKAGLVDLDPDFSISVTRRDLEGAIAADVEKIFRSISECLKLANISEENIDLVVLTGGSTELPVINMMVRARFPSAVISQDNKLDSVGLGLAYRAGNIF